eukprot:CAMPEP_0183330272 /NCGR_PEP_ID=MMETSP0160_2-20130417/85219_1 /TAXON_ID=2839 ORGANISM="Odontella Sinensis, Strain Grunow 1884" /NCGR_SAMPLE_ID=MMETSP0160_2 /ASSEMBLY_ACC=CAM_ASM_000250 /LENGTH=38 /DNA_ID= /DNA_START= /DNA_END= /DNA_ORIENTATION=
MAFADLATWKMLMSGGYKTFTRLPLYSAGKRPGLPRPQ